MAVVINPALSMQASGNVGGINYTRWRGMAVARVATTYTFTPNTAQAVFEGKLVSVVQSWGSILSAVERQHWVEAAREWPRIDRFGRTYACSGYQMFTKLNMQRSVNGLGLLTMPPRVGVPMIMSQPVVTTTGTPGAMKVALVLPSIPHEPEIIQFWQAGPFTSGGRHATQREFRLVDVERPAADYVTPVLVLGSYYWWRVRGAMDSGEIGNPFEVQAVAA